MSSLDFSLYFDTLCMINRGERKKSFSDKVLANLTEWGFILPCGDEIIITMKGLNVLEFYLKNREFMANCTDELQETITQAYSVAPTP